MADPRELLALTDTVINERLAKALGWYRHDDGFWVDDQPNRPNAYIHLPDWCSPDSPRRLLEDVEARITPLSEYGRIVRVLLDPYGHGYPPLSQFLVASAGIRARAALAVLEGAKV